VNAYFYSLLALDVARERTREAEKHWLAQAAAGAASARPSRIRRLAAQLLAAVSRGAAADSTPGSRTTSGARSLPPSRPSASPIPEPRLA